MPAGFHRSILATLQVAESFRLSTGGLRYAATTGYYLTALQAGYSVTQHSLLTETGASSVMLCGDRVFDKRTTAKCVAQPPTKESDEHRR